MQHFGPPTCRRFVSQAAKLADSVLRLAPRYWKFRRVRPRDPGPGDTSNGIPFQSSVGNFHFRGYVFVRSSARSEVGLFFWFGGKEF